MENLERVILYGNMKKKIIWAVVGAVILLFLFFWYLGYKARPEVKVEAVKRGRVQAYLAEDGVVRPENKATLSFKAGGRVIFLADEGQSVKKGQIIGRIDDTEVSAAYRQAQIHYDLAESDYQRDQKLLADGVVSAKQLQLSESAYKVAVQDLAAAKSALDGTVIMSPLNGSVAQSMMEVGEIAAPGVPVINVVDSNKVWLEIQIDETDVAEVKSGTEGILTADAYPDQQFKGYLKEIYPEAEIRKTAGYIRPDEQSKVFRARMEFIDSPTKFRPGMTVYANLPTRSAENVLIVPRLAVVEKDGQTSVFIFKGGQALERKVTTGLKTTEEVEIKEGLKEGDKVITSNISKLKNKTKVKISASRSK